MFQKLRNKLLFLNLTMMTIVIFSAFTLIFITTHAQVKNDNLQKLSLLSARKSQFTYLPSGPIIDDSLYNNMLPNDYVNSFDVLLNNDVVVGIASNSNYEGRFYQEISMLALQQKKTVGTIVYENQEWMYQMETRVSISPYGSTSAFHPFTNVQEITFLNTQDSKIMLQGLFVRLFAIGVLILVILYFISSYFANRAMQPLELAWTKQKQFVSDASHELKTPLAVIQTNLDVLALHEMEEEAKPWLEYIHQETKKMSKLINDLLMLARQDEIQEELIQTIVPLSPILEEIAMISEVQAFENELAFTSKIQEQLMVKANGDQIKAILHILMDNALKYADQRIELSAKKQGKHVIIKISNSSEDISSQQLAHLFDRFYRVDSARVREEGGYGLGLAIAKAYVEANHGKISVTSKDHLTTFILQFDYNEKS